MGRMIAMLYGIVSYAIFFITLLYAIGFVANIVVPKSIDTGQSAGSLVWALIANVILLSIFALQHSVMARPAFKAVWTRIIPKAIERSTYVLLSSLALILMFWQWRPMPDIVWSVNNEIGRYAIWAIFILGWAIVFASTYVIDHLDLFGLRQVYLNLKSEQYTEPRFTQRSLYNFVRHPIMLGFIIAFWATPDMSYGHLLFAVVTTIYILVAIQIEERDLSAALGDTYADYREKVPMIVPLPTRK